MSGVPIASGESAAQAEPIVVIWQGMEIRFEVADIPLTKSEMQARMNAAKPPALGTCVSCGAELDRPHPLRLYCSRSCQQHAQLHAQRNRKRIEQGLAPEPYATQWSSECPNCGVRFNQPNRMHMYCSPLCKCEAKAVRYARHKATEYGPDQDQWPEDIREALIEKVSKALGGNYDENARRVPPPVRSAVKDRDGEACGLCGEPGAEIDHIEGNSPDLSNLRLLCQACHHEITQSRRKPMSDSGPETHIRLQLMLIRMELPEPLLPSDSEDWNDLRAGWLETHRRPVTM